MSEDVWGYSKFYLVTNAVRNATFVRTAILWWWSTVSMNCKENFLSKNLFFQLPCKAISWFLLRMVYFVWWFMELIFVLCLSYVQTKLTIPPSFCEMYKFTRYVLWSFCRYGNANVWKTFTDLFDYFPLTALVSIISYLGWFACVSSESSIQFVCSFHRSSQKYFACMVDYRHPLRPSTTSATSIASRKFLMKVQCVIFCGLIQTIDVVGVFLHVVLGIPSDRYINYFVRRKF